MRGLDRRPLVAVAAGTALALVVGLRLADALLVGVVVGVLAVVGVTLHHGDYEEFPVAGPDTTHGARQQISVLTWSFLGRDGRVAEPAVRHLRAVAVRRLQRAGVPVARLTREAPADPADAAHHARARELLGERAWRSLTGAGGWLPSLPDVAHCVDVLERLGAPHDQHPATPHRTAPAPAPYERPAP